MGGKRVQLGTHNLLKKMFFINFFAESESAHQNTASTGIGFLILML
jgi:hypothetical protein